ncbi:Peroxisomal membrane protein PMP22 [Cardamine amara subsp. amara]|uniref:Peroxisomal membrane protein PMP22 n=1 Tax=Cardamine amara subsp. amara TaxID=228776 RepID=A0ABD1AM77_CARAN
MNIVGLSKRLFTSPRFSDRRSLHGINNALVETVFAARNPILGFSSRSFHHLRKAGNFVAPRVFIVSRNLSTNASSSSKQPAFLRWYLKKLDSHPFMTKSITTSLIYMAADLTSQMITMPPSGSFDLMRTARMASFGLLFLGPSQHVWFSYLSRILPKRDVLTTFKKIMMGQVLFGPCSNTVFYSYNAALQGENSEEIFARLKRDLLPTLRNGLLYWPLCDFVTFKYVPVHLQPLMNSSCAYIWTIYLTYMANQTKADS